MGRPSSYPPEFRDRAVRLVLESKADYGSEFEAIRSIAGKSGIESAETLRFVGATRGDRWRCQAGSYYGGA
jgi:transposase